MDAEDENIIHSFIYRSILVPTLGPMKDQDPNTTDIGRLGVPPWLY